MKPGVCPTLAVSEARGVPGVWAKQTPVKPECVPTPPRAWATVYSTRRTVSQKVSPALD